MTDDHPTLERDLRACLDAADHRGAVALLSRVYARRLRGLMRRLFTDSAEAEDALQEAWIAVLAGIGSYRFDGDVRSWLFRVAVRKAIDEKRRRRSFVTMDSLLLAHARAPTGSGADRMRPDRGHSLNERRARFEAKLGRMTERDQIAATLVLHARLGMADIAAILETSEVNVRKIKSRVVEALLAAVESDDRG
jgi:RNA polymerase sigma-70 factor (ECF subfamily)